MKDVAVIIVNWNGGTVVRRAVDTILEHSTSLVIEIIVVDNASSDGSDVALEEANLPGVRVVRTFTNGGYGKGNNLGAALADARYLAFVNPDVEFTQDVLKPLVDFLEGELDAGIACPRLVFRDGRLQRPVGRKAPNLLTDLTLHFQVSYRVSNRPWLSGFMVDEQNGRDIVEVDVIHGAFFVIPAALFEKAGRFDGEQFMYFDEILLCARVRSLGKKVFYFGQAEALHLGGELTRPVAGRSTSFLCQSGYVYYRQQKGRWRAELYALETAGAALAMLGARKVLGHSKERQDRERRILKWFFHRSIDIPR